MFSAIKNKNGSALLQVLGIGLAVTATTIVVIQHSQNADNQANHMGIRLEKKLLEGNVNEFFTSKENCSIAFSGLNLSGGKLQGFNLDHIKAKFSERGMITFKNYDFEIKKLSDVTSSVTRFNELTYVTADLEIMPFRFVDADSRGGAIKSVKMMIRSYTEESQLIKLPITFEFRPDDGTMLSCHSQSTKEFQEGMLKGNCEKLGGELVNTVCTFRTQTATGTTTEFNLQDSLCYLDVTLNMQSATSDSAKLFSQYCPNVKYSGCKVKSDWLTHNTNFEIQEFMSGDRVDTYAGNLFALGNLARTQRVVNHLRMAGEVGTMPGLDPTNHAHNESLFLEWFSVGSVADRIASGDIATIALSAIYPHLMVTGVLLAGAEWLTMGILDVIGAFVCDKKKRVTSQHQCQFGKMETDGLKVEKQKYRCGRWSCGCRWRQENSRNAPTVVDIAKNIVNKTPLPEEPSGAIPDDEIDAMDAIKKELNGISTFDEFYKVMANQDPPDPGNPPADAAAEDMLKGLVKEKEKSLWATYTNSLSINTSQPLGTNLSYIQTQLSFVNKWSPKLAHNTPAETFTPALNKINGLEQNAIGSLAGAISAATTTAALNLVKPGNFMGQVSAANQASLMAHDSSWKAQWKTVTGEDP